MMTNYCFPHQVRASSRAAAAAAAATGGGGGAQLGTAPSADAESLWDLFLFILHGAAPKTAERVAQAMPPASSSWRVLSAE
jgi:hypothetical protein